jgi:hypothetical protein
MISQRMTSIPNWKFEECAVALWTKEVLETLVSVLEFHSRYTLPSKSTIAENVFKLNNLNEVEKQVRSHHTLMSVVENILAIEKEQDLQTSSEIPGTESFVMPRCLEQAKTTGLLGLRTVSMFADFKGI